MSYVYDGGKAFPQHPELVRLLNRDVVSSDAGMTLRDYFAAHAPACPDQWVEGQMEMDRMKSQLGGSKLRSVLEIVAEWNYQYADAMIERRRT